jgi:hypothetical protein
MSQNVPKWVPSAKQQAFLETLADQEIATSITARCAAAGVDRRNFSRWMREDPGFREAYNALWRGAIEEHMPDVVLAQATKAREGDTPAATFLGRLGGYFVDKAHVTGDGGGGVVIMLPPEDPE